MGPRMESWPRRICKAIADWIFPPPVWAAPSTRERERMRLRTFSPMTLRYSFLVFVFFSCCLSFLNSFFLLKSYMRFFRYITVRHSVIKVNIYYLVPPPLAFLYFSYIYVLKPETRTSSFAIFNDVPSLISISNF